MSNEQREKQRLAEIDAIAHRLPANLVEKARNDKTMTAQNLALAQLKSEAEAETALEYAVSKLNKERSGHKQI